MCSTDEKPERRCRCVFGLNVWKMYGCIVKYLRYGGIINVYDASCEPGCCDAFGLQNTPWMFMA